MAAVRHILVAVDLSNHSPLALTKALSLAMSCHARLTVIHASPSAVDEAHRQELRARLSDLVGTEAPALLGTRLVVLAGDPSRAICEYARANDVDLIVVGRHHHSALLRFMFESAGEIVTRDAACPVLAVVEPQEPSLARRGHTPKILCAVGLDDSSGATLALASEVAQQTRAPLAVLHVIEEWNWPEIRPAVDDGEDGEEMPPLGRQMRRAARERLAALVSAHVSPAVPVHMLVSFGVPSLEIARLASEGDVSLVVVGAHSSRFLGHTVLGSTARCLLDEPPCSVLLARPVGAAAARPTRASEKEHVVKA